MWRIAPKGPLPWAIQTSTEWPQATSGVFVNVYMTSKCAAINNKARVRNVYMTRNYSKMCFRLTFYSYEATICYFGRVYITLTRPQNLLPRIIEASITSLTR